MVNLTNETPIGNINPVTFSGSFKLLQLSHSSGFYNFECQGLHTSNFEFEISESDAETSGNLDYEKIAEWIFEKIYSSVNYYNLDSGTSNIVFSANGNIVSVSGTVDVIENGVNDYEFKITVDGIQNCIFDVDVHEDNAGGDIESINPGTIIRWLLKKLKELICPECM